MLAMNVEGISFAGGRIGGSASSMIVSVMVALGRNREAVVSRMSLAAMTGECRGQSGMSARAEGEIVVVRGKRQRAQQRRGRRGFFRRMPSSDVSVEEVTEDNDKAVLTPLRKDPQNHVSTSA